MQGWKDFERGVEVRPTFGNQVNVCYTGLLNNSGADKVFLHYGYSDPQNWRDTTTASMERTPRGWEMSVPMRNHTMAFCFKDSANNWDNNNGHNWIART